MVIGTSNTTYWADLAQTCSLGPLAMSRILSLRLIHAMHALTTPFYPQIKIKEVQIKIRGLQIKITRH